MTPPETRERPSFGHITDLWRYEANVRAGRPLCERCRGGGNELYGMYRACSECSGSGIRPGWVDPATIRPEPWRLTEDGATGVCVAPSWPEWATTEEGDIVWVRADLVDRAEEVAADALREPGWVLDRRERVAMYLELEHTEWSGDWLVCAAVLEDDPHDVAVYVRFDVVEAEDDWGGDDGE